MSLRKLQQDMRNALFIGAAAAGAFLLIAWSGLVKAKDEDRRWREAAEEESVPVPQRDEDLEEVES